MLILLAGCANLREMVAPVAAPAEEAPAPQPAAPAEAPTPMPPPAVLSQVATPDLWTRFRSGRHWQPCELTPGVKRWIGRYAASRVRFAKTLEPALPIMDYVLTRSEALGFPSETMLLPIVESYYRPDARGPGGALGLWQLMPQTGRNFGLIPNGYADPRTDVIASTQAALKLLGMNAEQFARNPKLMYAAYNAGAYRLQKSLGARDMASLTSLDGLGLSRITRDYLDKVKALGCLLGEPERFELQLPTFDESQRLAEFEPTYAMDPAAVFALAGMDTKLAASLNRSAVARGSAGPGQPLLVRKNALDALQAAASAQQIAVAKPRKPSQTIAVAPSKPVRIHRVVAGDSLWTISRRYRVKLADLMRWNGLNKRSVLRLGQSIKLSH